MLSLLPGYKGPRERTRLACLMARLESSNIQYRHCVCTGHVWVVGGGRHQPPEVGGVTSQWRHPSPEVGGGTRLPRWVEERRRGGPHLGRLEEGGSGLLGGTHLLRWVEERLRGGQKRWAHPHRCCRTASSASAVLLLCVETV